MKVFLALALVFMSCEGAENRAATGLASEVAGLLRGNAIVTKCLSNGHLGCWDNSECCSGYCYNRFDAMVPVPAVCQAA